MSTTDSAALHRLGRADELAERYVNPYYIEALKRRVAVARVADRLYAFDDIYNEQPLSAGLLQGTTIMSQSDGSQFDVASGAVLRGPATLALATHAARERDGWIEVAIGGA